MNSRKRRGIAHIYCYVDQQPHVRRLGGRTILQKSRGWFKQIKDHRGIPLTELSFGSYRDGLVILRNGTNRLFFDTMWRETTGITFRGDAGFGPIDSTTVKQANPQAIAKAVATRQAKLNQQTQQTLEKVLRELKLRHERRSKNDDPWLCASKAPGLSRSPHFLKALDILARRGEIEVGIEKTQRIVWRVTKQGKKRVAQKTENDIMFRYLDKVVAVEDIADIYNYDS